MKIKGWGREIHIGRQQAVEQRADQAVVVQEQDGTVDAVAPAQPVTDTAAIVFGVGLYVKAFMAADIDPPVLSRPELGGVARDLLLRGEWVAAIAAGGTRDFLIRSSGHNIKGGYLPSSWIYDLTLPTPSDTRGSRLVDQIAARVAHVRVHTASTSPWRGISPLHEMGISTDLLACIETALVSEESVDRIEVLSYSNAVKSLNTLADDLSAGNRVVLLEQQALGYQAGRSGSANDNLKSVHIGADPPQSEVALRAQVSQDVLSALGIPAGLYAPREGSVSREAYRQWHAVGLTPLVKALAEELSDKLNYPVTITTHDLAAADVAARARAIKGFIDAGVEQDEAAKFAGYPNAQFAPEPEPAPVVMMPPADPNAPVAPPPGQGNPEPNRG